MNVVNGNIKSKTVTVKSKKTPDIKIAKIPTFFAALSSFNCGLIRKSKMIPPSANILVLPRKNVSFIP